MKDLFDIVSNKCSKITTKEYSTSFSLGIRVLDKKFQAQINLDNWELSHLYKWLLSCGIKQAELLKTFNADYGMALIASKKDIKKVERIINKHEFTSSILGKIAHKKRTSDKSLTLSGKLNK